MRPITEHATTVTSNLGPEYPPIDPAEPVPDDPGELSPDTPDTLPPAPEEPMPDDPDDPEQVPAIPVSHQVLGGSRGVEASLEP